MIRIVIASALACALLAPAAIAQTPTSWCDCMRFKKSTFQTTPWSTERGNRCTQFPASSRSACNAQGKGAIVDFDAKKK
jgi:hypothetical protein